MGLDPATRSHASALAQLALLVAAGAIVSLNWTTSVDGDPVRGYQVGIGAFSLIVIIVTIALVQFGSRPAWTGAGFVVAALGRELIRANGSSSLGAGPGLWLGTAAALTAAALLVVDLFQTIRNSP